MPRRFTPKNNLYPGPQDKNPMSEGSRLNNDLYLYLADKHYEPLKRDPMPEKSFPQNNGRLKDEFYLKAFKVKIQCLRNLS